ncbi:MAG: DNA repair protein RadA [Thiohalomonadales bacterium]
MAKQKIAYVCKECGGEHTKWQGQCDHCGEWNSLAEFKLGTSTAIRRPSLQGYAGESAQAMQLADVSLNDLPRISTGLNELDRVLGGGLVPGSAVLIGGQPGAGKSTLLLQVLSAMSSTTDVLYVSGEESLQQVALRANRLNLINIKFNMLAEIDVDAVCRTAEALKPKLIVIDSIQVMYQSELQSTAGGVAQVRECAARLTRYAKQTGTVLFLVGHVTKDGSLAGPKVLEHIIDCSLMLESSEDSRYRTLRSTKNRFGAVNELGVFAMTELGLKEIKNPSAIFLTRTDTPKPGSIVMVVWEGTRPMLIELQALVDDSGLANPRRLAVGVDALRLAMLLAVLHRHGGIQLSDQDVYLNVVGGVKVSETSTDLAVVLALLSSFRNQALPMELVVFGEIGLSGEIRPVANGQERLREAVKHGFRYAIVPKANAPKQAIAGMKITPVEYLSEAIDAIRE